MQYLHKQTLQKMYIASLSVIAAHNEDQSNLLLTKLKSDTDSLLTCKCQLLKVSEQYMLEFCQDVLTCLSKETKSSLVKYKIEHLDIAAFSNGDNPAQLADEELAFIQQQFIE